MFSGLEKLRKEGEAGIEQAFNELFNECLGNINKMAELSIFLDSKIKESIDDEKLYILYSKLQSRIIRWSDSLSAEDYYKFCKLSHNESIIKEKLE